VETREFDLEGKKVNELGRNDTLNLDGLAEFIWPRSLFCGAESQRCCCRFVQEATREPVPAMTFCCPLANFGVRKWSVAHWT